MSNSKPCLYSWPETASTSITHIVTGSHQFKIVGYSLINDMPIGTCISSAQFTVDGYNWIIRYYPKGYCQQFNSHMAVLLELRSEAQKLTATIEFNLHDINGTPTNKARTIQTFESSGSTGGFSNFMQRSLFDAAPQKYIKDDCLVIGCTVSIRKPSCVLHTIAVPPSVFHQQFGSLLESNEGMDVTFEVKGQTFGAHRCVLAARSPVFKAELFGEMEEKKKEKIKIDEMEAPVFKAMLHFIYNDSLPDLTKLTTHCCSNDDLTAMAQHLLVAADRYALERLKILCAEMLYNIIEESNAANMLALAERHNCSQLKDACLQFIATPKTLRAVITADGFEHLIKTYPSILKDLGEKSGTS